MIDRAQLVKFTHDALTHLYDLPYLLNHPLAGLIDARGRADSPGRLLRRLLLDAIQQLKPPAESPHDGVAATRYQFLYLRYVQGKSIEEIGRQFCVGERQLYRRQRDALDAVATILAQELQISHPSSSLSPNLATPARSAGSEPNPDETLSDQEHVQTPLRGHTAIGPHSFGGPATQRLSPSVDIDRIGLTRALQPIDLPRVFDSVRITVAPLCESSGRSIQFQSELDIPPVAADRVALRQALLALLIFALENARDDPITIEIASGHGQVQVCTAIPSAEQRGSIAEIDSNLAVCRRLIELQGGQVRVSSHDLALAIVLTLPAYQPRRVLIVDDNADTSVLFARYVEARGHRVLVARTGEEALQIAKQEQPDAIILDVMLPSSDGYETLQALRSDPAIAQVPVVVCTVLKQRDLALALGATDFLTKPVTQGDLLAALDRCWKQPG